MTSDGKIVPYRMSVLMEIVLDYIHLNIEDSKRRNEAREKENRDVSEDK